jgi:O-antigen/teichoic acid export membrane protein
MMKNDLLNQLSAVIKGKVFTNSAWGIFSSLFQNILFSIFFVVIARRYNTDDFANYILANTLYGFVVAFSSLGLGQWFIRTLLETDEKKELIYKFFKIQIIIGLVFYVINIILSYSIYDSVIIRQLSLLIGINIVFDNIIYVIKFLNIAELEQKKSFIILTIEASLKFLIACLLFITYIPILYLSIILICLRFITLNIFISWGTSKNIQLRRIISVQLNFEEIKKIIIANWSFIVIGSISVVYWRIGNILISKILTLTDVANYEISYKLFSIAEILPFIVSTSVFPLLINTLKSNKSNVYNLYKKAFVAYSVYGILVFTFIFSFSDMLIPILFGKKYAVTALYCKEMFLTILIFPTALLQANLLIAMKHEKIDMWFNAVSLFVNIVITIIGLYFIKSLIVVNYAIFFSFLVFHVLQDIFLVIRKITKPIHALLFYIITSIVISGYYLIASWYNAVYLFFIFWACVTVSFIIFYYKLLLKKNETVISPNPIELKDELSNIQSNY